MTGGMYLADTYSNQAYRILSLYDRLYSGATLVKKIEAAAFHVDEKTIQRDFNHIRAYLAQNKTHLQLTYDRKERVYKLVSMRQMLQKQW